MLSSLKSLKTFVLIHQRSYFTKMVESQKLYESFVVNKGGGGGASDGVVNDLLVSGMCGPKGCGFLAVLV